jgi:hypothetical protein
MVIFRQKVYTRNVLLIGVVAAAFGAKSIWRLAIGNADSVKFMLIDFLKICIFIHLFIFIYLFILIYLFINIYLLLFYDILCIFAKTGNPSIDLVSSSQSLNVSLCRSTTQQVLQMLSINIFALSLGDVLITFMHSCGIHAFTDLNNRSNPMPFQRLY